MSTTNRVSTYARASAAGDEQATLVFRKAEPIRHIISDERANAGSTVVNAIAIHAFFQQLGEIKNTVKASKNGGIRKTLSE